MVKLGFYIPQMYIFLDTTHIWPHQNFHKNVRFFLNTSVLRTQFCDYVFSWAQIGMLLLLQVLSV